MLLKTLKAGADALRRKFHSSDAAAIELPREPEQRLGEMLARAPVDRHLRILLGVAGDEDLTGVRDSSAEIAREPFFRGRTRAIDPERVRTSCGEFPRVEIVRGWVPEVLSTLGAQAWAFVHLDVNLNKPTLAALDHLWPRLVVGGVIASDDYGSPFTPGPRRAWNDFSAMLGVPLVVLGEHQAVLPKQ